MLRGKTYLVTGSTDGIGKHTIAKLAAAGANVLVHGRNQQKVTEVVQHAKAAGAGGAVSSYTYDLSSFSEVRKLADAVRRDYPSIDVLINNAGMFSNQKAISKDGLELVWAVNALAPFLLTSLLLDTVKERIIVVGSQALAHDMDFDNLQQEKGYNGHNAYAITKLANLMFSNELAPVMRQKGVMVNCVHPGIVATNVLKGGWGGGGVDAEKADDVFNYATSPVLVQNSGNYYVDDTDPHPQPPIAQDPSARKRLWKLMQQQTGAQYPSI